MSPLEMAGVGLNVGGVWLTARRHMLCWPVGIVGVLVYGYLFWQWKLYGDMALQLLYVWLQIYGWVRWRRDLGGKRGRPAPVRANWRRLVPEIVATCGFSVVLAWAMIRWTDDAMPRVDATLTCFSLLATAWAARRHLQSWILWVIVDTAYTVLFWVRGTPLTAVLYAAFTGLAVYGAWSWHAESEKNT